MRKCLSFPSIFTPNYHAAEELTIYQVTKGQTIQKKRGGDYSQSNQVWALFQSTVYGFGMKFFYTL